MTNSKIIDVANNLVYLIHYRVMSVGRAGLLMSYYF